MIRILRFTFVFGAALFLALALLAVMVCAALGAFVALRYGAYPAALGYGAVVVVCAIVGQWLADL